MNVPSGKVIWEGSPSQWVNANKFSTCGLVILFIAMTPWIWRTFLYEYESIKTYYFLASKLGFFGVFGYATWNYLVVKMHKYILTDEVLLEKEGVLNVTQDELQLYRVKDMTMVQPFSLRMVGCSNIILDTSDKSTPIVVIYAVKDANKLLAVLRTQVEHMRTKKGVRQFD